MNKLNVAVLLLLLGCTNTTEAAKKIDEQAAGRRASADQ